MVKRQPAIAPVAAKIINDFSNYVKGPEENFGAFLFFSSNCI